MSVYEKKKKKKENKFRVTYVACSASEHYRRKPRASNAQTLHNCLFVKKRKKEILDTGKKKKRKKIGVL